MPSVTMTHKIHEHLRRHGAITPDEANLHYGCRRLAARIWDLRHDGLSIQTLRPKGEDGCARYVLMQT